MLSQPFPAVSHDRASVPALQGNADRPLAAAANGQPSGPLRSSSGIPALAWVLGISLSCLSAGAVGLTRPLAPVITLKSFDPSKIAPELLDIDLLMEPPGAGADSAPDSPAEIAAVSEPAEPLLEMAPEPEAAEPEFDQPPELAELLNPEDAPPIAELDQVVEPAIRKPAPVVQASRSPAPRPSTTPSATPGTASASAGGAAGGSSGGAAKGFFPAPPYPAFAKTKRLQGTVVVAVSFGPDGRPSQVLVSRSCGYSDLDRYASDFIRRNWKSSGGIAGTVRQPIQFVLR
jgi:protein TonB